jgi:hypothetical protein
MKKFTKLAQSIKESNESELAFYEAFEKFIKGQTVKDHYSISAYGDHTKPHEERFYGEGMIFENGYKYLSHGGGCSGEDCNTSFIVDPQDKLIAVSNW